jgi:catechol 2,3-dioxygenase-like lactoylglutathione lyase family enzyme
MLDSPLNRHDKECSLMKFGYMIIYVPDVAASLQFFSSAFGLNIRFLHESATYGELETGETALAFAADELAAMNFNTGHVPAHSSPKPLGIEVGLVTEDVQAAHARALKAGATEISTPSTKPWGQTVSYVRCPDGTLVELCTPVQ